MSKTKDTTPRATVENSDSGTLVIEAVKKGITELRETSKRGEFLKLLKQPGGVTMQKAANKFDWKPRDVADALRLLARKNGYTVKRDNAGHWHAVGSPKAA